MTEKERPKVIFDTNIWVSYIIGQQLKNLTPIIVSDHIEIIYSDELVIELKAVTKRPKLSKYFRQEHVEELLKLIRVTATKVVFDYIPEVCRDPKDNFLLGLALKAKADYLVTGDKDLLDLNPFEGTTIIQPEDFMNRIQNMI